MEQFVKNEQELGHFIEDIKKSGLVGTNATFFLPAMPIKLGTTDPNSYFQVAQFVPLYFKFLSAPTPFHELFLFETCSPLLLY